MKKILIVLIKLKSILISPLSWARPLVTMAAIAASGLITIAMTLSSGDGRQIKKQPEEVTKALQPEKRPETVQSALDINWKTTRLGSIPKKYDQIYSILLGPDGRRFAAVVIGPGGCFVVDGNTEKEIYCLSGSGRPDSGLHIFGEPIFSPDGRKLAYVTTKGFQFSAVINGKEGKPYAEIDHLVFSPDSRKLAYVAREQEKIFVVVNDKEEFAYEYDRYGGAPLPPVFSRDSDRLAFVARENRKDFVVVKDKDREKKGKPYDWVYGLTFSSDNQRIAYKVKQGGDRWGGSGKEFVVIGDSTGHHEGRRYDSIRAHPIWSSDGRKLAYIALENGKSFVVVNERPGKEYDGVGSLAFTPRTEEIVYVAHKGGRLFLVVGDTESESSKSSKSYERIANSVMSHDRKDIMLVVWEDVKQISAGSWTVGKEFIVLGNREGKRYGHVAPYGQVHGPIFSPDSRKFAYVATRRRELKNFFVVLGDREGKEYDGIKSLVFSPDSKVLTYVAEKAKKQLVVIGSKEGKPFDEVVSEPIFSPNSNKIAYGARLGNDLWWIVDEVR